MSVESGVLTLNRNACPVCCSPAREILFTAKHNSPGFIDFINFEPYWSKAFYEAYRDTLANALTYEIAECSICHMHYLTEALSDLGMGALYNTWLDQDKLKAHYSDRPFNYHHYALLGLVSKGFASGRRPRLLDFGAGYGNFVALSQKRGFETYAFDLSADKNHSISSKGVSIVEDLSRFTGYFDFIWVNQVLEHLSDPSAVLGQLSSCLAKGGLMYLAVPDCANLKDIIKQRGLSRELFQLLSPHQHINAFSNSTLRLIGENSGLKSFGVLDYFALYNPRLGIQELKLLAKKILKNSQASTGLLFKSKC